MVGYLDPTSALRGLRLGHRRQHRPGRHPGRLRPGHRIPQEAAEERAPSSPSRPPTPACSPARSRSSSTMTSTPTGAMYKDMANVEFVIPAEGSIIVPYVMSLVKNSPKPEVGKKVLDFVLSDQGPGPCGPTPTSSPFRPSALSPEVAAKFLPESGLCPPPSPSTTPRWPCGAETRFRDRYRKRRALATPPPGRGRGLLVPAPQRIGSMAQRQPQQGFADGRAPHGGGSSCVFRAAHGPPRARDGQGRRVRPLCRGPDQRPVTCAAWPTPWG